MKVLSLVLLAVLSGCDIPGLLGTVCDTAIEAGIEVDVRDAATGRPLALRATGEAFNGRNRYVLRAGPVAEFYADSSADLLYAFTPAGIYDVTITREGYVPWTKQSVRVREQDECTIQTTRLEALLSRDPRGE